MIPMLEFLHPGRMWLLLLPVGVLGFYLVISRRVSSGTRRRGRTRLDLVIPRDSPLKRHVAVGASLLAMASLVLAYAQPLAVAQVPRERATVVITIDISRSMRAQDVSPSRIDAAKTAAIEFVDTVPSTFNIALVSFAGTAQIAMAPTTDRSAVKSAIESLELEPATAIGEAIYASLDALLLAPPNPDNPDELAPGAIIILSDGYTNIGRDSGEAASVAREENVPIYAIAYGTAGGYVYEEGVRVPVPVNHAELSQVAKNSGGKKYSAESLGDLRGVYQTIASAIGYDEELIEITDRFALYALILSALAAGGVISLAARWP